ncbi:hypothetical protein Fleli_0392 [Bernardetia litoralis DSM 6794]|uniref:Uncharacterized protein n=1 Tax=Bernardetia litoralis (strain ATCC 23117 / DSM 6794 / NBRC 15988 / NCIMB 1366 / Fx l1 / Sio-4) TaxID=880071 RepID=I4AFY5_BERLS|nr:hypothetical protein [Bernardetia litoralis]AFM02870.1 hypothetical protein Fleli_0392 [Bernardetia litoralis DSM 6794]
MPNTYKSLGKAKRQQFLDSRARAGGFENKLLKFAFLAIEVQKTVRFIRKKCNQFKQKGFISLQRMLCFSQEIIDLLQNKINIKT